MYINGLNGMNYTKFAQSDINGTLKSTEIEIFSVIRCRFLGPVVAFSSNNLQTNRYGRHLTL